MNAPARFDRAVSTYVQAKIDRFLAAFPNVVHAEYGQWGRHRARVILLRDGEEWEGFGTTLPAALGDAGVKAAGGYPKLSPPDGGWIYRHSTGQLTEIKP